MNLQYADKGLIGLANLGNTCFLHTVVQCLSHTYELNDFLNKKEYRKKLNPVPETILLIEWDKLRELIWSGENDNSNFIVPRSFTSNVRDVAKIKKRDLFTGFAQNDAPEFLYFLINSFHEAIKRQVTIKIVGDVETPTDGLALKCFEMFQKIYSEEYSELLDVFYGIHISRITDTQNKVLSEICEPYFSLSLQIPGDTRRPDLLACCAGHRLETLFQRYEKEQRLC
jgi:ubiquitin C-terminal hydrolase